MTAREEKMKCLSSGVGASHKVFKERFTWVGRGCEFLL